MERRLLRDCHRVHRHSPNETVMRERHRISCEIRHLHLYRLMLCVCVCVSELIREQDEQVSDAEAMQRRCQCHASQTPFPFSKTRTDHTRPWKMSKRKSDKTKRLRCYHAFSSSPLTSLPTFHPSANNRLPTQRLEESTKIILPYFHDTMLERIDPYARPRLLDDFLKSLAETVQTS